MCYTVDMILSKKEQLRAINSFKGEKKKLAKECHELWREIVFLRAGYKCEYQDCHREATQPHHIITKGSCNHLRYDPDNGMALCYPHHKGSGQAAHSDINFKDKILGRYPGFKPIRTEQWLELLVRKSGTPQKLDLRLEVLYLRKKLEEMKKR
jgi:hypothetical protein